MPNKGHVNAGMVLPRVFPEYTRHVFTSRFVVMLTVSISSSISNKVLPMKGIDRLYWLFSTQCFSGHFQSLQASLTNNCNLHFTLISESLILPQTTVSNMYDPPQMQFAPPPPE